MSTENKARANARNEGSALSQNDLLSFLDDDVIVDPNLVEQHVDVLGELADLETLMNNLRYSQSLCNKATAHLEVA